MMNNEIWLTEALLGSAMMVAEYNKIKIKNAGIKILT